jgi:hypothetical protein
MMLHAKTSAVPKAATASRRAAWRRSSAGIVQAGAATPEARGESIRGRDVSCLDSLVLTSGAGARVLVGSLDSAGSGPGSRRATRRRQPEQSPSTHPLPARTVPHCWQVGSLIPPPARW